MKSIEITNTFAEKAQNINRYIRLRYARLQSGSKNLAPAYIKRGGPEDLPPFD